MTDFSQTVHFVGKLQCLVSRLHEDQYAAATGMIWTWLLGAAAFWIVHWRVPEEVQAPVRAEREQALAPPARGGRYEWHAAGFPKDDENGRTTTTRGSKPRSSLIWRTPKIIDHGPNDHSMHEAAVGSTPDREGPCECARGSEFETISD
jgi:hypothetical protein